MKSNTTKFIEDVVNGFQQHKGKASVYCYTKSIIPNLVNEIIVRFRRKHCTDQIFIVVDEYKTRQALLSIIIDENVKILSKDFIKKQYRYTYSLIVIIGVNDEFDIINLLSKESKFTLCVLTRNIMNTEFINNVRNILPNIETSISDNSVKLDRIYTPVEEIRCGVDLSDEDRELYDKYTEFINTSISIFGNLDNIEKCKIGDVKLNISGSEFRYQLAKENGWNEHLDTKIEFQKQIDEIYNPNILYERACTFYTIAKKRRDLVTDSKSKFKEILDICLENKDKQILIVSKRGEYAREVTKYLCENGILAGDYHDCIENMIAVDDNNIPILVKSGKNKGKPKIICSQSISSINSRRFNEQSINVLSIKNSSSNKLKTAVDLVILTSSLCDIIDIKQRFTEIVFNGETTKVYKIFANNTIEYEKLNKEKESTLIKITNKYEENFIQFDENSGSIIL